MKNATVVKQILCILGGIVSAFIFLIGCLLAIIGVTDSETSMAIVGFVLLICGAYLFYTCFKHSRGYKVLADKKTEISEKRQIKQYYIAPRNILYKSKQKKTITCKTCEAEISPRAKRCPHCGEMTPGETASQIVIGCITAPFIAIGIFIALGFYFGLFSAFIK